MNKSTLNTKHSRAKQAKEKNRCFSRSQCFASQFTPFYYIRSNARTNLQSAESAYPTTTDNQKFSSQPRFRP